MLCQGRSHKSLKSSITILNYVELLSCSVLNVAFKLYLPENGSLLPPQDRDFCLLHPEDPLFQTFSGETLKYKGKEPLYPFFVNECAYYEKSIALSLARKRCVMVPPIRVQTDEERQAQPQELASEEEE